VKITSKKKEYGFGTPKRDGSGRGVRANKGRGGCKTTETVGKGRNKK